MSAVAATTTFYNYYYYYTVSAVMCYSAIEDSLVGTSGQSLITDLYHGKMTNSIQCRSCLNTSEHDEVFCDLGVSVLSETTTATPSSGTTTTTAGSGGRGSGRTSLEDSLTRMFSDPEVLDASNRYRCGACGRLTDAVKHSRLIHVPPILTVSLLRFNYDPLKKQRYKETGNFEFPLQLDMSHYLHRADPNNVADPVKPAGEDCIKNGLKKCEEFIAKQHNTGEHRGMKNECTANGRDFGGEKFRCDNLGSESADVSRCSDCSNVGMSETDMNNCEACCVRDCGGGRIKASGKDCSLECCSKNGCELGDKLHSGKLGLDSGDMMIKTGPSPFVKPSAEECSGVTKNGFDFTGVATETVPSTQCDKSSGLKDPITNVLGCGDSLGLDSTSTSLPETKVGAMYELFAVVVHRGSAHGGHYHALIRDVDARATWTEPESPPTSSTADGNRSMASPTPVVSTTGVLELDTSSPRSLITSILLEPGTAAGMRIGDLSGKIASVTGRSWRKGYKPRHGSFTKFLTDNADLFTYNPANGLVSLVQDFDHLESESKSLETNLGTGSPTTDRVSDVSHRTWNPDTVVRTQHSSKEMAATEFERVLSYESETNSTDTAVCSFPSTEDQDPKLQHRSSSEFEHVSLSDLEQSKNDRRQERPSSCKLDSTETSTLVSSFLTTQDPDPDVLPSHKSEVETVPSSESEINVTNKASGVHGNCNPGPVLCPKQSKSHTVAKEPDISSPRSVITCILRCSAGAGLSVTSLCSKISAMTGNSWRKRYKPHHGSLVKFLADNSDLFVHDISGGWVTLNPAVDEQVEPENPPLTKIGGTDTCGSSRDAVQHPHVSSTVSETRTHSRRNRKKKSKSKHTSTIQKEQMMSTLPEVVTPKPSLPEEQTASKVIMSTLPEESRPKPGDCRFDLRPSAQTEQVYMAENVSALSKEPRLKPVSSQTALPAEHPTPKPGYCWFDFNDSIVRPICTSDIQKHFSGKECAYMLFYRAVPPAASDDSGNSIEIPDWLISEIAAENHKLVEQRAEYEEFVSAVKVEIHFGRSYECHDGILRPRIGACYFVEHSIDVRRDVDYLLKVAVDIGGELAENCQTVHIAKLLPCGGIHLYQEVTASPAASPLKSCGIAQSTKLFVWNGCEVDGMAISVGSENEPISLRFGLEASQGVYTATLARSTSILALRSLIARHLELDDLKTFQLYLSKGSKREFLSADLDKTLSEVGLRTRDRLIVCGPATQISSLRKTPPSSSYIPHGSGDKSCPKQLVVSCENHVGGVDVVTAQVEADSSASIQELKVLAMTCFDVPIELVSEVRLRVRLDDLGVVGPPLYESIDLVGAGLSSGTVLVLEHGMAPADSEIVLSVALNASTELELMVDRDMAIHQLVHEVLLRASRPSLTELGSNVSLEATATDSWIGSRATGLKGPEFHLCRTDWTGDASAPLREPHHTVTDACLNHGDRLFLRPGCPPPPGFLKIFIHPESSPARPCWWDPVRDMAAGVLPDPIGSVVVSKSVTLVELKHQIMSEVLQYFEIPGPLFLRVRTLDSKLRPGGILHGHDRTLNQTRIGSAVGVEVLPVEEDLGVDEMMLTVRRRLPGQRQYADWSQEVIWNTGGRPTVESLRHFIAESIGEADSSIRLAKHIPDKYDWLVIPHSADDAFRPCTAPGGAARKKRRRKGGKYGGSGGSSFCDLKSAPFHLQDGDVIGVKVSDEPGGQDSDFSSVDDDVGRENIKSRSAASNADKKSSDEAKASTASTPRVETAIRIHVDNFR